MQTQCDDLGNLHLGRSALGTGRQITALFDGRSPLSFRKAHLRTPKWHRVDLDPLPESKRQKFGRRPLLREKIAGAG